MHNVLMAADSLLTGGWTPEDRDEIMEYFDMTESDVDAVVEQMRNIMDPVSADRN